MNPRRVILLLGLIACIAVLLAGGIILWKERQARATLFSLQDVLWVCDREMTTFYPPGSPESLRVCNSLAAHGLKTNEMRFDHFLCCRMGAPIADAANEPVVWDFDPTTRALGVAKPLRERVTDSRR